MPRSSSTSSSSGTSAGVHGEDGGRTSSSRTTGIAAARFVNEFFREPDAHLAYVVTETGLSRGQWLTIPMIALGLAVIAYSLTRRPATGGKPSLTA